MEEKKVLSLGGKKILIKNAVQVIPAYVMSCFLLPVHLIRSLNSMAILQIPVSPAWPDDRIIWHLTPNGIYTVKSSYKEGMNYMCSSRMIAGASNLIQESKLWNSIHNLAVQPKIRIFIWQASLNILPTSNKWRTIAALSFKDLIHSILSQYETGEASLFAVYTWLIYMPALHLMNEYKLILQETIHFLRSNTSLPSCNVWKPPNSGYLKVNTDVAFSNNKIDIGIPVSNHLRIPLLTKALPRLGHYTIDYGEYNEYHYSLCVWISSFW
ncbi:hypothetical protein M9H77_23008 [Catharanthus roseus]|uniref:Uncharacterized protein n=1 Tax=Catharanthus roseus TaxID=4058 RepID=A0ACC0AS20_CATRO|nr:hypothetical protein M9H77_23008 [Catharanthus roseus]